MNRCSDKTTCIASTKYYIDHHWYNFSRYKPKTKGVSFLSGNTPIQNASRRLFGVKAKFVTKRKSTQILELDNNPKSCASSCQKEVSYCTVDIACDHNSVDGNAIE